MKIGFLPGGAFCCAVFGLAACGQGAISYKADVQPILAQYCNECHATGGEGQQKSGLDLSSYQGLMKGTKFGAVVKPGDTLTSAMVMLVEGRADPSIKMPHGRAALPREKIDVLKKWVEQGAKNN